MTPELQTAIRNGLQVYASVVEDALKLQRQHPDDPKTRDLAIKLATRYHDQVMARHAGFSSKDPVVAKAKRLLAEATVEWPSCAGCQQVLPPRRMTAIGTDWLCGICLSGHAVLAVELGPVEAEHFPVVYPIYEESSNEVIA